MKKTIYLDNAATTKTRPEVVEAMFPYFTEFYGNPSSIYSFSDEPKKAVAAGREAIAKSIGAKTNELYFTGGGSESDNWALKATAEAYKSKGNHIITSKIEHHAILHTCEWLENHGFEVSYIDVDENGVLKLDELKKAIRPTTILISVMFANNEIGTIQPIKEIGEIAKKHGILFHTDAVQAENNHDRADSPALPALPHARVGLTVVFAHQRVEVCLRLAVKTGGHLYGVLGVVLVGGHKLSPLKWGSRIAPRQGKCSMG